MFKRFPSLTRFSQGWTITEKIDGTNAQVLIWQKHNYVDAPTYDHMAVGQHDGYLIFAGSRSRMITPQNDNMGFARYVQDNAQMLIETLGEGRHFGEWWGRGIQRGYGLEEKRFSLFNALRWKQENLPEGLYVVPTLIHNEYLDNPGEMGKAVLQTLKEEGSYAAPGFMDPEGIVMFHRASGVAFKKTFDYDEFGKWMKNQASKS